MQFAQCGHIFINTGSSVPNSKIVLLYFINSQCVCVCVCVCACVCACVCCVCVCLSVCLCVHACVCLCACMYVRTCMLCVSCYSPTNLSLDSHVARLKFKWAANRPRSCSLQASSNFLARRLKMRSMKYYSNGQYTHIPSN